MKAVYDYLIETGLNKELVSWHCTKKSLVVVFDNGSKKVIPLDSIF